MKEDPNLKKSKQYCFSVKETIKFLKEKYMISTTDSHILCQKLLDKNWIEATFLDKKTKEASNMYTIVRSNPPSSFFLSFD